MGEIQVVSAALIEETAAQKKINEKVEKQIEDAITRSNTDHTENKAARGVIRKIMDENKAIAHEEVQNLAKEAEAAILTTMDKMAEHLSGFKADLTSATEKVFSREPHRMVALRAILPLSYAPGVPFRPR